jgi:hypothetical protein
MRTPSTLPSFRARTFRHQVRPRQQRPRQRRPLPQRGQPPVRRRRHRQAHQPPFGRTRPPSPVRRLRRRPGRLVPPRRHRQPPRTHRQRAGIVALRTAPLGATAHCARLASVAWIPTAAALSGTLSAPRKQLTSAWRVVLAPRRHPRIPRRTTTPARTRCSSRAAPIPAPRLLARPQPKRATQAHGAHWATAERAFGTASRQRVVRRSPRTPWAATTTRSYPLTPALAGRSAQYLLGGAMTTPGDPSPRCPSRPALEPPTSSWSAHTSTTAVT